MTGTIIDRNDMVRRCWTRVDMIEDSHKPFWVTGTILYLNYITKSAICL